MTLKILDVHEVNENYATITHPGQEYLVPFQEIADFKAETVRFREVYVSFNCKFSNFIEKIKK